MEFPCRAGGALADSKCTDMQAGIESTMVMLPSILAGIDFILHGGGILDSYNVISYDKFLMDEEMTKMCMYMKNGVEVTEETLAVDTIMEVEHGGEFLTEEHTLDHMYDMLYIPELLKRTTMQYGAGKAPGRQWKKRRKLCRNGWMHIKRLLSQSIRNL